MRFRKWRYITGYLRLFLILIAVGACQPAQAPSTAIMPTILPAQTQEPTSTFTPVPSPTYTSTPFPALSVDKPYLMIRPNRESRELVIYDANGTGRKIIELPTDGHIKGINSNLSTIVSPDGQWLVFYTGSLGNSSNPDNLPITLKLLNVNDGTIKKVADVVSNGYKDKLAQLADKLKKINPDYYDQSDNLYDGLFEPFIWGIYSIAWSSDSHRLAFAAQLDGLSSDVYVYDLATDAIQQAEDALQSVSGIRWSPDDKKIIFKNTEPTMHGYMGASGLHQRSTNSLLGHLVGNL
jgi:hypothetical protein